MRWSCWAQLCVSSTELISQVVALKKKHPGVLLAIEVGCALLLALRTGSVLPWALTGAGVRQTSFGSLGTTPRWRPG